MISSILSILISANIHNPQVLAYSIANVSNQERVDPITLTKMVIVESKGNPLAVNSRTEDYGILQIHLKAHPEIGFMCAMTQDCGLKAGAKILKTLSRPCEYNLGKRGAMNNVKKCLQYESNLDKLTKEDK